MKQTKEFIYGEIEVTWKEFGIEKVCLVQDEELQPISDVGISYKIQIQTEPCDIIIAKAHAKKIFENYKQHLAKTHKNEMFKRYEAFLHRICWKYAHTMEEHDELFCECSIAYLRALQTFNSAKGEKLITYIGVCAENACKDWLNREKRVHLIVTENMLFQDPETEETEIDTLGTCDVMDYLSKIESLESILSLFDEKCTFVYHLLLLNANLADQFPPKIVRGKLVDFLRKEGWSWSTIWSTFRKIKKALDVNGYC